MKKMIIMFMVFAILLLPNVSQANCDNTYEEERTKIGKYGEYDDYGARFIYVSTKYGVVGSGDDGKLILDNSRQFCYIDAPSVRYTNIKGKKALEFTMLRTDVENDGTRRLDEGEVEFFAVDLENHIIYTITDGRILTFRSDSPYGKKFPPQNVYTSDSSVAYGKYDDGKFILDEEFRGLSAADMKYAGLYKNLSMSDGNLAYGHTYNPESFEILDFVRTSKPFVEKGVAITEEDKHYVEYDNALIMRHHNAHKELQKMLKIAFDVVNSNKAASYLEQSKKDDFLDKGNDSSNAETEVYVKLNNNGMIGLMKGSVVIPLLLVNNSDRRYRFDDVDVTVEMKDTTTGRYIGTFKVNQRLGGIVEPHSERKSSTAVIDGRIPYKPGIWCDVTCDLHYSQVK